MPGLYLLSDKMKDLTELGKYHTSQITDTINFLRTSVRKLFSVNSLITAVVSGQIKLVLDSVDRDIAIAGPNGAATGTFKRKVSVSAKTTKDQLLCCILDGAVPTITPGKTGAGFNDPTISPAQPVFKRGVCVFDLIYSTDAGATQTYAPGDTVTCAVDFTNCGNVLPQVVLTDTLIA